MPRKSDKRSRPYLKQINDSWPVDETYVKVRGRWLYLYQAVIIQGREQRHSAGQTLDFLLDQTRSTRTAKRFFRKSCLTHINYSDLIQD